MLTIDEILARRQRTSVVLSAYAGRPVFTFEPPGLNNSAWVDWQLAQEAAGKQDQPEGESDTARVIRMAAELAEMFAAACLRGFRLEGAEAPIEMGAELLRRLAKSDPLAVIEISRVVGIGAVSQVEVDIPGEASGG